jgi:ERCC4-type nuclease
MAESCSRFGTEFVGSVEIRLAPLGGHDRALVKILVDIEERRSSVPTHLEELAVSVEMVVLPTGDYLIGDRKAVERKTVADLHRSIASSRLWSQVAALARMDRAYLLIEGSDIDAGPISPRGIRGAVLQVIDNGLDVIRSSSPSDTAVWLRLLAARGDRSGAILGRRGRRRPGASPLGALAAVPGISPVLAHRLLTRFGSIAGVAAAASVELQEIEGIGSRRADALRQTLLGTFPQSGEVP